VTQAPPVAAIIVVSSDGDRIPRDIFHCRQPFE
jgi:hypothetical protein